MIGPARTQAYARAVIAQGSPRFGRFWWSFKPLPPPDTLQPVGVYRPACVTQAGGDLPSSVAVMNLVQLDYVGEQHRLIVTGAGSLR